MEDAICEIRQRYLARRQFARIGIALYFFALAMGILPCPLNCNWDAVILPKNVQSSLFSIIVFAAAYAILIGRQLRLASSFLMALVLAASLLAPAADTALFLLRDGFILAALLFTGGWFLPSRIYKNGPGRIRLTRIAPPQAAGKSGTQVFSANPFGQSPDDMVRLFDQLGETH